MIQTKAKFIGSDPILRGEVAEVKKESPSSIFVQARFFSIDLPERFTKQWNLFVATQFEEA